MYFLRETKDAFNICKHVQVTSTFIRSPYLFIGARDQTSWFVPWSGHHLSREAVCH
jgi:hypothetical protein